MNRSAVLIAVAAALVVAVVAFILVSPRSVATPSPTLTPAPASAAATATSTVAPTVSPPPSPTALSAVGGTITGRFGYGADYIPPVTVYAISTTDFRVWYSVAFAGAGNTPGATVPPGVEATYTVTGVVPQRQRRGRQLSRPGLLLA